MYIGIEIKGNAKPGEVVIIKSDNEGGIGAFLMTGEKIGEPVGRQPEGCVDYWAMASTLYNNRVLCRLAVRCGDTAILQTDSRLLASVDGVKFTGTGVKLPAYSY